MSAEAQRVALCVGETRALRRTAEAMRAALEAGDTERLHGLVEVQEIGIWRLGRLMKGDHLDDVESPADLEDALLAAEDGEDGGLRQTLTTEMRCLAEVSGQNAVLLKDGLMMVRGMLAILTGRFGNYGGGPAGPAGAFNRRA